MRSSIVIGMLLGLSLTSRAQMYGTGMSMGMQACPYQQDIGDAAEDKIDDINDANDDLKELRSKLSEEKSKRKELESKQKRAKEALEKRGFKDDYLSRILDHVESIRNCYEYEGAPPRKVSYVEGYVGEQSRMPAAETN